MNLANRLTLLRIILIPIMLWLFLLGNLLSYSLGFLLANLIGWTDYFDGYIARRYGTVTQFGEFLDPLADKIFVISVYIYFVKLSLIPGWLAVLFLAREIAVTDLRIYALTKNIHIKVSTLGKTKTVLQSILLFYLGMLQLLRMLEERGFFELSYYFTALNMLRLALLYFVALFTLLSMWLYLRNFSRQKLEASVNTG